MFAVPWCKGTKNISSCIISAPFFWLSLPQAPTEVFICAFNFSKDKRLVLFFDEADSFLGKRIQNVSQGSEQAINSLRSTMLIQLEKYHGVVIFATNLTTNYDAAFKTRFLAEIEFPLPDKQVCIEIFRKNGSVAIVRG